MQHLTQIFVLVVLLGSALASIAVWAPRRVAVKAAAMILFVGLLACGYAGLAGLLSRPKPVALEWAERHAAEAKVLGASIREGKAIYVWLELQHLPEPRAYALPWDLQTAQQLQKAMQEAAAKGTAVQVSMPFEAALDEREPKFYAEPQAALPPKVYQHASPTMVPPSE